MKVTYAAKVIFDSFKIWQFSMERTKSVIILMALKEVNAKEAPEMTQEEVIALQGLNDAFVLAKAAAAKEEFVEDLIKDLDLFIFTL